MTGRARVAADVGLTVVGVALALLVDRVLAETSGVAPVTFVVGAVVVSVTAFGRRSVGGLVLAVPLTVAWGAAAGLSLAGAVGSALSVVLGGAAMGIVLRRFHVRMKNPTDPIVITAAALVVAVIAGVGGALADFATTAAATALGAVLLVPAALAARRRRDLVRHPVEFVVVATALAFLAPVGAGRLHEVAPGLLAWLLLPVLLAVGLRYGVFAAALATLLGSSLSVWLAAQAETPSTLLQLQGVSVLLATVVLAMLLLVRQQRVSAARERAAEDVLAAFRDHADSMWYLKSVPSESGGALPYLRLGGGPFRNSEAALPFGRLRAARRIQGPYGIIPVTDVDLFGTQAAEAIAAADQEVLRTGESSSAVERLMSSDGRPWTVLSSRFPVRDDTGRIVAVGGIRTDITEREQLAELRDQQRRLLKAMFERSPLPSLRAFLDRDGKIRVAAANEALGYVVGRDPTDLVGSEVRSLFPEEDWPAVQALLQPMPSQRRHERWDPQAEVRVHTRIGQHRRALVTVALLDVPSPHEHEYLLHVEDVTARRAAEEAVAWFSLFDVLTGLLNRAALGDRLDAALHRLGTESSGVALVALDLDDFTSVNDSHGHSAGDLLLVEYGSRIRRVCDPQDSVARFSADEFAVLVEWDTQESVALFVGRLQAVLAEPVLINDTAVRCTASFGVSLTKDPTIGAGELVRQAELALYRAKRSGRGKVEFYAQSMRVQAQEALDVRNEVTWAVTHDGLAVAYQPIVGLNDGAVIGVEALVRLPTQDGRLLAPAAFLDVARSADLVSQIDRLVLRQSLADLAARRLPAAPCVLSVNVEPDDLRDADFGMAVLTQLHAFSVTPELLTLEVTEAVLLSHDETVLRNIASLREAGVQFAIDDFGTGYSSLAQLRQLPVDIIKIDRSFVSAMAHGNEDADIVATIIGLAHQMGLLAVAEGIETRKQAEMLRRFGCDRGQGYLFGHPQPISPQVGPRRTSAPTKPSQQGRS